MPYMLCFSFIAALVTQERIILVMTAHTCGHGAFTRLV
jgi:hypothetical protein